MSGKKAPQHFAVLLKGRTIEDPLTEYRLESSALRRLESLRKAGHECELVPVPRALVAARAAAVFASTRTRACAS